MEHLPSPPPSPSRVDAGPAVAADSPGGPGPAPPGAREDGASAASAGTPDKPRVIGRYTIQRELRRERHSVTYAAVDPVMNRQLIVKAVSLLPVGPRLSDSERQRVEQAFMRQAQAAGRLHHPHIVTVFDAGLSHAFGYLVIEKINGRSLPDMLSVGLKLAHVQATSIVARLADALAFAHRNGVSHGHLGPQHVYLLADGTPKIAGFGGWIDDGATGDVALAETHRRLPYFQNEVTDETRTDDIRSLGMLLFLLLTGQSAPRLDPESASAHLAPEGRGSLTRNARPVLPLPLARLCDQAMLAGYVADCPASAAELRDALTAFLWSERHESVALASLGLPLAPPPQGSPVHMTTIVPEDNIRPLRLPDPPSDSGPTTPGVGSTASARVPGPSPFATLDQAFPAPVPDTRDTTALRDLAPESAPASPPATPWHARPKALISGLVFVVISILLGVILAQFEPHPVTASAPDPAGPGAGAPAGMEANASPVSFDIRPWGEVFVDGHGVGVAPPMKEIELPGGVHRIEIRHGSAPAWRADVEVRAPTPVHIEHRFKDDSAPAP